MFRYKSAWVFLLILVSQAVMAQNKFYLEGIVGNKWNGYEVELRHFDYKIRDFSSDSTIVENGHFTFKGTINEPDEYSLNLRQKNVKERFKGYRMFILEPKKIRLAFIDTLAEEHVFKEVIIEGSTLNKQYDELEKLLFPTRKKFDPIYQDYSSKTEEERNDPKFRKAYLERELEVINEEKTLTKEFILAHPDYYVSLIAFENYLGVAVKNVMEADSIFSLFSAEFKATERGKRIKAFIDLPKRVGVGLVAPGFSASDLSGKIVHLKNIKSQYVLVDFWASWCGPCMAEMPYLKEAYNKYKGNSLEIVGVSIDRKKADWLQVLKNEQLSWINLFDDKSEVSQLYGVKYIPQNFLIGPDRKIVALNLRGGVLEEQLSEIFEGGTAPEKIGPAVTIEKVQDSDSLIKITLDLNKPICSDRSNSFPKIKLNTSLILMHAGVGTHPSVTDKNGNWTHVVEFNSKGADGTSSRLIPVPGTPGAWSITINPRKYFGVPSNEKIYRINMVFNSGYWSQGEAKNPTAKNPVTGETGCGDFCFELPEGLK